ncbi:hypothetical protein [Natrarchaeobaculum sulfurireducens]|uniref:Uncharacterized protein n=1 Tax=Natrarchaeobaculum sulfurireducens TaxID=2044521 RepID=A0A346PK53_9EURY|nr:hypothetical protein [Natrarchaeobaculum sulfurireducens]AXR79898.1 hypothetical protein AArcMg_4073 [Natrarchaeobaculum sulfurireducens]
MTTIQQVLFELEADYLGHPYYVTGNAIYNALASRVDGPTRNTLQVSHGVFVPGEYGQYPDAHSRTGGAGAMGRKLHPVERYEDLFVFRHPSHRWLLDGRPRDAHNTHDLTNHGGRLAFAPTCYFGRPPHVRNHKRSVTWHVYCYLHGDGRVLPLSEETLDGLCVGGARNYGFGELSVVDTQTIDLEALDYSRLEAADKYVLELLSPYVLETAYPGADGQRIPWWWETDVDGRRITASETETPYPAIEHLGCHELRLREERLVSDGETYSLETVDHGQLVGYAGDTPIQTAKNGVRRVGTHAKFGFGEFRVWPATDERVATLTPRPSEAHATEQLSGGA